MDLVIKDKWIKALESGEYRQTSGYLTEKGCYCALGVLCDIYEKETGEKVLIEGSSATPYEITKWAKLDSELEEYVISLNDISEFNFNEIADYLKSINQNLEDEVMTN